MNQQQVLEANNKNTELTLLKGELENINKHAFEKYQALINTVWNQKNKQRIMAMIIPASQLFVNVAGSAPGHLGYSPEHDKPEDNFQPAIVASSEFGDSKPPRIETASLEAGVQVDNLFSMEIAKYLFPERKLKSFDEIAKDDIKKGILNYKNQNPQLFNSIQQTFIDGVSKLNPTMSLDQSGKSNKRQLIRLIPLKEIIANIQLKGIKK